jgi:hypothetical protein
VEPAGELRLVVSVDDRVVLGEELADADVRSGLAVGQVMDDLAGRPLVRARSGIQLGFGRSGKCCRDDTGTLAVLVDEGFSQLS